MWSFSLRHLHCTIRFSKTCHKGGFCNPEFVCFSRLNNPFHGLVKVSAASSSMFFLKALLILISITTEICPNCQDVSTSKTSSSTPQNATFHSRCKAHRSTIVQKPSSLANREEIILPLTRATDKICRIWGSSCCYLNPDLFHLQSGIGQPDTCSDL